MMVIETDASSTGLGAVLLQETDLGRQPIAYASRSCSPQEKNYSATEIECLGVIFALKTFRCYVIGSRFRLVTDHQALKNLKLVKKPSGRVARWLMTLLEYDFELVYRSGKLNTTADCLSRLPRADSIDDDQMEDEDDVVPIVAATTRAQQAALMKKENQYQRPRRRQEEILSGTIFSDPSGTRLQMVVPEVMRTQILQWAHEGAFGTHVGREKAFEALLEGYWWPNMARDLGHFIRTCSTCQQYK
ncbi:unnamed protein product, partial [Heterosigma akashiwo]